LVRKVLLENKKYQMSDKIGGLQNTLGEELLKPTKIYVKEILDLLKKFDILGIAHITGGGLIENIPRILPEGLSVVIDASSWQRPPVFSLIQKDGNIAKQEMYRTFNMGIGMVLIVPESESEKMLVELESMNCESYIMGQVIKGNKKTIIK
jgi:phosphoribosylformylglycinamidine cyclo-ligase